MTTTMTTTVNHNVVKGDSPELKEEFYECIAINY